MNQKGSSIKLKSFKEIFGANDNNTLSDNQIVQALPPEKLVPFKNHPFKLYEGERFNELAESIKENGIMMPVIVRPADSGTYEILSGHNRVNAAKFIGLEVIPCIIRENLTDDEAVLIVTETNLIQRSFSDLSHSEKAAAIAAHHESVKNQGRRTDLINEIEELLENNGNTAEFADSGTSRPVGEKLGENKKTSEKYELSSRNISRYLRINKLINELKKRVDSEEISIRAAVELSYIPEKLQAEINSALEESDYKIDIKKSQILRAYSDVGNLNGETIKKILGNLLTKDSGKKPFSVQPVKITGKVLSKYFRPEQTAGEIQAELIEALEFFRAVKKNR
jgi:ParB family chromosome partitioning protein